MAEAAIFVGWGAPVRGRESKSLEVFNDAVAFWGGLQQSGDIESFDIAFLTPHGGELNGFALIRGSRARLDDLLQREDFQRINTRANLVVERFGIVRAIVDEAIGDQVAIFQEAAGEMERAVV